MKSLSLFFICCLLISSCSKTIESDDLTAKNIEDLKLYTFNGEQLAYEELVVSWNEMVNEAETPNQYKAGTFEIKKIQINDTDEFEYALVATNTADRIQTAAQLIAFEDGYKINNRSVTCHNCDVNLESPSSEGYWYCNGSSTTDDCTKTSRMFIDDNIVSNPESKMLFSVQFTAAPQEGIKTLERKVYSVYTNTSNKKELCSTKSLLSDIAYEETWIIENKNDPMQNRQRTELKKVNAQEVLEIMCNAGEEAIFAVADLEKFGEYKQEYTAFFK